MNINISGVEVCSGDVIIADPDGIIVIPLTDLDEITMRCYEILELETELDQKVLNGLKVPNEIELLLESENVQYV